MFGHTCGFDFDVDQSAAACVCGNVIVKPEYMAKAHARTTDPITSHEAANSITLERLTQTQEIIVKLLDEGMTDEELVNAYQAYCRMSGISNISSPSGIRSRRNELYRARRVEAIAYGKSTTGRRAIVWQSVKSA